MPKGTRGDIWFERKHLRSKAFRNLSRVSILVYLDFLRKRKRQEIKANAGRKGGWITANNGEIVYTYKEAEGRGIGRRSFRNAIDELIEKGFIDIAHQGSGGRKGDVTLYSLSERWKDYGTDKFIEAPKRVPDRRKGRGFAAIMADPERRDQLLRKRSKVKSSVCESTLEKGRLSVGTNTPNI